MSGERDVAEKAHAELGASSAHRWMSCPGSVRLSRGLPEQKSEHAQEGTRAHALAELALRRGVDPDLWVGLTLEGGTVDDDMADYVRLFVEHCRQLASGATHHWVERRFNLLPLNPPVPMFGTADFVAYDATTRHLHVVDLKYGSGVVVEVTGNPQLRYYALGAALSLGREHPVDTVTMTIVQPRVEHPDGIIRSETISIDDLLAFSVELLEAAKRTQEPDAPLITGPHCRWCKAKAICPEQYEQAQAIAQIEFESMPADIPPAPETLPSELFAEMLGKLPILEDWIHAMYAHARTRLEQGEEVPGWKLVEKRAVRVWTNERAVIEWLQERGYAPDEYMETQLKSPAQIEKMLGKAKKELPAGFVQKISSGLKMVPESDPAPAVPMIAGAEFAALLPASTENDSGSREENA